MVSLPNLKKEAINLLKELIAIESISGSEDKTASLLEKFLIGYGFHPKRKFNNIWVENDNCPSLAKVILLNSHHDTVKPSKQWSVNPFTATIEGDKIIGLGSNDAGASVVSLLASFIYLSKQSSFPYKIILALSAEEEIR